MVHEARKCTLAQLSISYGLEWWWWQQAWKRVSVADHNQQKTEYREESRHSISLCWNTHPGLLCEKQKLLLCLSHYIMCLNVFTLVVQSTPANTPGYRIRKDIPVKERGSLKYFIVIWAENMKENMAEDGVEWRRKPKAWQTALTLKIWWILYIKKGEAQDFRE